MTAPLPPEVLAAARAAGREAGRLIPDTVWARVLPALRATSEPDAEPGPLPAA